jgi:histidinol dehydrogenase
MKIIPAAEFSLERQVEYGTPEQNDTVRHIIKRVRAEGDEALRALTEQFDRVKVGESFQVSADEIQAAYSQVDVAFIEALRQAAVNIRDFHEKQKRTSWMDLQDNGTMLGQVFRPLKRVGLYDECDSRTSGRGAGDHHGDASSDGRSSGY